MSLHIDLMKQFDGRKVDLTIHLVAHSQAFYETLAFSRHNSKSVVDSTI